MRKERMTVAQAMIKALEAEGINTVFGYPGAAIETFYDELRKSDIRHILVRHEVNAGHAASGYARISGKPAVCVATSGPGATNLITAIATAYMDSIPMVIITGQVNTDQIGRDVFQEADITGAAEPFVKHSYLIKEADEFAECFKRAFYIAGSGRQGPVLLDIPIDVQQTEIDFAYPETVEIRSYKPSIAGNKLQIKRIVQALSTANCPLICAGGGLFANDAQYRMIELAEMYDIPVINTLMGLSTIPAGHRLYFGMLGMYGNATANHAASQCDMLILLGARVGDRAVAAIQQMKKLKTVVHIDIDPAEIGKNLPATIPVVGDASTILGQILEQGKETRHPEWVGMLRARANAEKEAEQFPAARKGCVNPRAFIAELNAKLPQNAVLVADVGQNQIWTANGVRMNGGRFLTSGGMGTMGYSLPAAIGARLADSSAEVISVCGDGSFQMQSMELATEVQHKITVKTIIMVNKRLGMVRELQQNVYGDRQIAVDLDGSPDFIRLADAYGIKGESVTDINEAEHAIGNMLASKEPYILQVLVDENENAAKSQSI